MNFIVQGKPKAKPGAPSWLRPIFDNLYDRCKEDIFLVVSQTDPDSKLGYLLEHRRSKLKATIQKNKKSITIKVYALIHGPLEQTWVPTEEIEIQLHAVHVEEIATFLLTHVCVRNQFWHGKFERVVVSAIPDPRYPYYGGKVVEVIVLPEHLDVLTESGMRYKLPKRHDVEVRHRGHYLVIKDEVSYGFVSDTDFKTFYNMA